MNRHFYIGMTLDMEKSLEFVEKVLDFFPLMVADNNGILGFIKENEEYIFDQICKEFLFDDFCYDSLAVDDDLLHHLRTENEYDILLFEKMKKGW